MQPKEGDNDFTLILKHGKEMRVSRNEIAASSDFFSTLLNSDMRENKEGTVRLEHITEAGMRDVLEFVRSGSVEITTLENAKELIEAAEYLLLDRLKTFSEKYLVQETLTSSNCMTIYYFAEQYRCQELTMKTRQFILSNFTAVTECQDFLCLDNQQVVEWIFRDDVAVSTEDVIFKAIVRWIQHSKSERKGKFEELFRYVRLFFISRDYLLSDVLANDLVSGCSSCLKLTKEAVEGKCPFQSPRVGTDTHLVVYMGKETYCYEPDGDKWYELADTHLTYINTNFYGSGPYKMCSCQGKLYVFPNSQNVCQSRAETFDPSLNGWTTFDYQTGQASTQTFGLAVVRGQLFAVHDDRSEWYCGRGRDGLIPRLLQGGPKFYLSKYNFKSNTWTDVHCYGSKPVAATGACIIAMDTYLYVIVGLMLTDLDSISPPYRIDTMSLHSGMRDGGNLSWDRITEMKKPREGACGTAAHGKIFIAGGLVRGGCYCVSCEVYNIEADEWQLIARLNSPRLYGSMVYLKGILYVVGGRGRDLNFNKRVTAVESYDFEEKKWKEKTKLPIDKTSHEWKYDSCTLCIPRILVKPILKRQQGSLWPLLLWSRQSAFR
ncbi:kelch-like protein 11 [Porites lutea]|uniref:kelch-like protein 11 n=1 Tax=Porites lutea TaxID=51062 RepID=UPI003CC58151